MRLAHVTIGVIAVAAMTACGGQSTGTGTPTETNLVVTAETHSTPPVDHTDPLQVVSAVFAAAKARDPQTLSGLCDPQGENDSDTQQICDLKPNTDLWESFVPQFENSSISGPARITGTRAEVDFTFAPRSETMILVARDGRWYLSSF